VGDVIDLDDGGVPKSQAPGFITSTGPMVYVAEPKKRGRSGPRLERWYVETNRFGHYLVFDASKKQAEKLAQLLDTSPLGLIRWGESYRTADDGYQYEWFARLDFDGTRAQCLASLGALLDGKAAKAPKAAPVAPEPTDERREASAVVPSLLAQVAGLSGERDRLRADLASAEARTGQALQERDAASADKRTYQDRTKKARAETRAALAELARAQDQVAALAVQLAAPAGPTADIPAESPEVRRLKAQLSDVETAWLEAQEAADARADELRTVEAELGRRAEQSIAEHSRLQARIDQLEAGQQEATQEAEDRLRVHGSGRHPDVLGCFLADVFPRLRIDAASVEQVESEFPDPRTLYKLLGRLERREDVPRKGTSFPQLMEAVDHVPTGNPDCAAMGRVYTRPLPDGRLWVFVHRKRNDNAQQQFMKRIAGKPVDM
jgi:hypothetical protein